MSQIDKALRAIDKARVEGDRAIAARLGGVVHDVQHLQHETITRQQKEVLARVFRDAAGYTNLVMMGGYAGAFALWQLSKQHLTAGESLCIGLSLASSVMLFVGFEVFKMISLAVFFRRIQRIINKGDLRNVPATWEAAWTEESVNQSRIWAYFVIPTVLSGLIAGLTLLSAFLRVLVGTI